MNITIKISDKEEAGIRKYLESQDIKATKEAISVEVRAWVQGIMYAPQEAVSEFINLEI
jgi:hypothetical protein